MSLALCPLVVSQVPQHFGISETQGLPTSSLSTCPFPCLQQAEDSGICFTCRNGVSTPYSKGSITFTVVASDRPGFTNYYSNPTMQQFVQASRVRVRFQGHFHVSNIRHEYFALYELRVSGRWEKLQGRIPMPMEDLFFLCFFLGREGVRVKQKQFKASFYRSVLCVILHF